MIQAMSDQLIILLIEQNVKYFLIISNSFSPEVLFQIKLRNKSKGGIFSCDLPLMY